MIDQRNQDEVNQAEWKNADNWSSIYFSKKDSRTCVRKMNPKHGWTINCGSASGARWIYYFFGIFLLVGIVLGVSICLAVMGVN